MSILPLNFQLQFLFSKPCPRAKSISQFEKIGYHLLLVYTLERWIITSFDCLLHLMLNDPYDGISAFTLNGSVGDEPRVY
jgi:hypothetical protein